MMNTEEKFTAFHVQRLLRETRWTDEELASRVNSSSRSVKRWKTGTPPSRVMEIALWRLYRRYVEQDLQEPLPKPRQQLFLAGQEEPCAIFVDGLWLHWALAGLMRGQDRSKLSEIEYMLYGNLPRILQRAMNERVEGRTARIIRTHVFGMFPAESGKTGSPERSQTIRELMEFFARLKRDYHYEIKEAPSEKAVDVQMVTELLAYYTDPHACSIMIVVTGDVEFVLPLQAVRRSGRRVATACFRQHAHIVFSDPYDRAGIRDFDTIWLDDLVEELTDGAAGKYAEAQDGVSEPDVATANGE